MSHKTKLPQCYAISLPSPLLKFGQGNAKLAKVIATFSIPAGHTCPFADLCLSKADKVSGLIKDGPNTEFRCFAASQECTYPNVRLARWHNFDLLKDAKTIQGMADLINKSLPKDTKVVRVHVSGDFYSESYFLAWLNVALNNPQITFYGYTKALVYLVKYKANIPVNFRFTASCGGKQDNLIKKHKLRYAKVVFSTEDATAKNLAIDHDDGLAMYGDKPFALLLHGTQPPKSAASRAWRKLVVSGIGGYSANGRTQINPIAPLSVKIFIDKPIAA